MCSVCAVCMPVPSHDEVFMIISSMTKLVKLGKNLKSHLSLSLSDAALRHWGSGQQAGAGDVNSWESQQWTLPTSWSPVGRGRETCHMWQECYSTGPGRGGHLTSHSHILKHDHDVRFSWNSMKVLSSQASPVQWLTYWTERVVIRLYLTQDIWCRRIEKL